MTTFTDSVIELPGQVSLALRTSGPRRARDGTMLLVHGLASNARLWDGVAAHLPGFHCIAVDARGHGASPDSVGGYDTGTAAADLAAVVALLDAGDAGPLPRPLAAVGQSWGGNVVLSLAAEHPGLLDAAGLVDGGWLRLTGYRSFEDCWADLAPPDMRGVTAEEVEGWFRSSHPGWPESGITATLANLVVKPDGTVSNRLAREHHRSILRSLYDDDPRQLYPLVNVPVLLMPAGAEGGRSSAALNEAIEGLPDATLRRYPDADHDIHAQFPADVAADLMALARRVTVRTA